MKIYELLSDEVTVDPLTRTLHLRRGARQIRIGPVSVNTSEAIISLAKTPQSEISLIRQFSGGRVSQAVGQLVGLIGALAQSGWLRARLIGDDGPLITIEPIAPAPGPLQPPKRHKAQALESICLDPSCVVRIRDGEFVLESGKSRFSAQLNNPSILGLLDSLLTTSPGAPWLETPPNGLSADSAAAVVNLLLDASLATTEKLRPPEDELWSDWEMLFHARSRAGRNIGGYGSTYRFAGKTRPSPGVPERRETQVIELPPVDLSKLQSAPLIAVTQARRSIREHDHDNPITKTQLGELLARTQRLTSIHRNTDYGDTLHRSYPAGGSLYELEIYPLVNQCSDLDKGLYHYLSDTHALELVAPMTSEVKLLAELSGQTALMRETPQLVLLITARFSRVMWKYEGVAYEVILKDLGVLLDALYLHATDMNLAPCALGGGDSDLFCRIAGTSYFEETTVGEFVVGARSAHTTENPSMRVA